MNMSPIYDFTQHEVPDEVARVLSRGRVISIKSPNFPVPILSIIQRLHAGCLYFRVSDELLKNNVLLGDPLTCQIIEEGYEYVLNGIVGEVQPLYPREMQFIIKDINIYKNMRKNRRYNVNFPAEVFLNRESRRAYTIVHNISIADLNMICKEKADLNDRVDVDLMVNKDTVLKFKATIARVAPSDRFNEYGMRITEIDDVNRDRLEKVIYELQMDEGRFVAESLK
jgi:hypothetical protein